jgi:hypothetical protein
VIAASGFGFSQHLSDYWGNLRLSPDETQKRRRTVIRTRVTVKRCKTFLPLQ